MLIKANPIAIYPVACFDKWPVEYFDNLAIPGMIRAAANGSIQTNQALVAPISNPSNSVAIF